MGIAGTHVQMRTPNAAQVETTNGPLMNSSVRLAGFAMIEAGDPVEAVDPVSRSPCAVAHGVVEVWPLEPASQAAHNSKCKASNRDIAAVRKSTESRRQPIRWAARMRCKNTRPCPGPGRTHHCGVGQMGCRARRRLTLTHTPC